MDAVTSPTQRKRLEKIARLRKYFGNVYSPRIYEWEITDEPLDFARMNDGEIAAYLKGTE